MTWSTDSGIAISTLMATIKTRLEASGWTLTDRYPEDRVWHSTNSQGATNILQITNCQTSGAVADSTHNRYLQFQGWRVWTAGGTHAGTDGSGTTYHRLYYALADVADTVLVDLYMSVTANRAVIFVQAPQNMRHWAYFGGLKTDLAGTADPYCVVISSAYENISAPMTILGGATNALWTTLAALLPATVNVVAGIDLATTNFTLPTIAGLVSDVTQMLAFPIMGYDLATNLVRGLLDGVLFIHQSNGLCSHLDTVVIDGITYLIVIPGGATGTSSVSRPLTGNFSGAALALAEV
jgi:hypothetical protein